MSKSVIIIEFFGLKDYSEDPSVFHLVEYNDKYYQQVFTLPVKFLDNPLGYYSISISVHVV